jgi:Sec-independent protein translocase protein TatA
MGLHFVDIIVVAAIALALFGSKSLQSMAHNAGKTMGQAKQAKDKIIADLPLDAITNITDPLPHVPTNPRQALQMLLKSDEGADKTEKNTESASE